MKKRSNKKAPKTPAKLKVGTYQLGYRWVDLWLCPETNGGTFDWCLGDNTGQKHCQITVGARSGDNFWSAWSILVHETMEAAMCDLSLRYRCVNRLFRASDTFLFVFNHDQFTEVAARVGAFVEIVSKDFEKSFKKMTK